MRQNTVEKADETIVLKLWLPYRLFITRLNDEMTHATVINEPNSAKFAQGSVNTLAYTSLAHCTPEESTLLNIQNRSCDALHSCNLAPGTVQYQASLLLFTSVQMDNLTLYI